MKCHYNTTYIQLTFKDFVKSFPRLAEFYKRSVGDILFNEFLSDEDYMVRLDNGRIEVGYKEDVWAVG